MKRVGWEGRWKKGKLDYGTPKVSERKQLKRNYDNSLEGTESVRKEVAGYHSQSLNKYVVESQFCILEHETIWKDRKQVHGHLAGKERCKPLSRVECTQTSRWVAHSGKGCQDTKSCRTCTDHYGKGPGGNSGSGKPRFSRWFNSSKQNLRPNSLEAMTNVWSPNIVPNIVDRDKIIL